MRLIEVNSQYGLTSNKNRERQEAIEAMEMSIEDFAVYEFTFGKASDFVRLIPIEDFDKPDVSMHEISWYKAANLI